MPARGAARPSGCGDQLGQDRDAVLVPQLLFLQASPLQLLVAGQRQVPLELFEPLLYLAVARFQTKELGGGVAAPVRDLDALSKTLHAVSSEEAAVTAYGSRISPGPRGSTSDFVTASCVDSPACSEPHQAEARQAYEIGVEGPDAAVILGGDRSDQQVGPTKARPGSCAGRHPILDALPGLVRRR